MATRTKEGFEELGYTHGTNGAVSRYQATDHSWQAQAYRRGWDRVKSTRTTYTTPPRRPYAHIRQLTEQTEVVKHSPRPLKATQVWFDELKHLPPFPVKGAGIDITRMDENTRGWPHAAAEHAKCLAREINSPATPLARQSRLYRSLVRLQKRYASGQQ